MCSVHILTSFTLFVKEVTCPPVDGCRVPSGLSFFLDHWFPQQCTCTLLCGAGDERLHSPPQCRDEKGEVLLCPVLQFAESISTLWSPSDFPATVLTLVHSRGGWDQGMWHFKNPWHHYELLFLLHVPLSPSVGNSPSEPFLSLPYVACSFSFSAHNPVRHLISLCSSVQLKIGYCHLPMGWLSFYLVHSIFHGSCE